MKSYPAVLKSLLNNEVPANATQENYEHFAQLLELHNSGLVEGTLHKALRGSAKVLVPPSEYSPALKGAGYKRDNSLLGILVDIIGAMLIGYGLYCILK